MPYGQIQGALGNSSDLLGHIESTFEPSPGLESARSFKDLRYDPFPFEYQGVANGRICFKTRYTTQYEKGVSSEAETINSARYVHMDAKLLVRSYATLDAVTEKTEWEEGAKSDIDQVMVTIIKRTNTTQMWADTSTYRPGVKVLFEIDLCGKAPPLDATTRYLSVSWLAGGIRTNPLLFLWAVDPPAGSAEEPAPEAETGPAPTETPRPSSGTKRIIDVLAADGRFTWVVKIITFSGLEDTLATDHEYTLFAPTDARIEGITPRAELAKLVVAKNHDALRPMMEQWIVSGIHEVAELRSPGASLSAKRGFLHFEMKKGAIYLLGGEILVPPLRASNGLIYGIK